MAIIKKLFHASVALGGIAALLLLGSVLFNGTVGAAPSGKTVKLDPTQRRAISLVSQGRRVFRFNTFGDEAVWGGVLGLHKAIEGSKLGGVGAGISPKQAQPTHRAMSRRSAPPSCKWSPRGGSRPRRAICCWMRWGSLAS